MTPEEVERYYQAHLDEYKGKHARHPKFRELFGNLAEKAGKKLDAIEKQLGIKPRKRSNIHIYLRDGDPHKKSGEHATTYTSKTPNTFTISSRASKRNAPWRA